MIGIVGQQGVSDRLICEDIGTAMAGRFGRGDIGRRSLSGDKLRSVSEMR